MPTRMRLTDIDLVETLESPEYLELKKHFNEKKFKKGTLITLPNSDENVVFVVKSGKVRVYLSYEDKEFTLSILDKGDIFSSHTRAFTQALEDCDLLISETVNFTAMLAKFPTITMIIVKVLGDLLRNSITIINGLVFKDISLRLAEFLLQAIKDKGKTTDEGILLNLGLNTEQVAMILGASRQTVSVLINDLYKSGIATRKGRGIILIRDVKKLKEMATQT